MQIIDSSSLDWSGQEERHRVGALRFKNLFKGDDGDPNNFRWVLSKTDGDYRSPLHRHNFDQIRFCLKGSANIAPGKHLDAGDVGYFPEGTYYGPQEDIASQRVVLVLQFGGASGLGYMSSSQLRRGQEELERIGTFARGRFRFQGEPEDQSRDSYEAIWENVFGRPMQYPAERYADPIIMRTASFTWLPDAEHQGVRRKLLGVFTERGVRIELIEVEAGSAVRMGRGDAVLLMFALTGSGRIAGRSWRQHCAVRLDGGETTEIEAAERSDIFAVTLPLISAAQSAATQTAA